MDKLALFFGGESVEHDISIITGIQMYEILKTKYLVVPIYIDKKGLWYSGKGLTKLDNYKEDILNRKDIFRVNMDVHSKSLFRVKNTSTLKKYTDIDIAFNACHGGGGEDGSLSGLFNMLDICYTGSDVLASSICMDKCVTKTLLKSLGIDVVDGYTIFKEDWKTNREKILKDISKLFNYSVIIKPATLGSSIGITVSSSKESVIEGIDTALTYTDKILIEEYILDFKEVNIALLKCNKDIIVSNLQVVEKKEDFLSFKDKYLDDGNFLKGENEKDIEIDSDIQKQIEDISKRAYINLSLSGIIRIDYIIKKEKIYLNEINVIPGSLSFYLFKDRDILFKMIEESKREYNIKKKKIKSFNSSILRQSKLSKYVK